MARAAFQWDDPLLLDRAHLLVIAGGFSYADALGAGLVTAFAASQLRPVFHDLNELRHRLELPILEDKPLARRLFAPDLCHREGRAIAFVRFGHAGGDMGMVMLHLDQRQRIGCGILFGKDRREVIGMVVTGHEFGLYPEQFAQMVDGLVVRVTGGVILEIADVLAQDGAVKVGQADGALQFGAGCQQWRNMKRQRNCPRGIAAGPAVEKRRTLENPDDGIILADLDRPVVDQKRIGDRSQSFSGVFVVEGDRFIGCIAARHD